MEKSANFAGCFGKVVMDYASKMNAMTGEYTDDRKFVITSEITCYDVDARMRLKPASFMDMAQEIAYQAASRLGFGYDELQEEGKAWVLSRMHYRFLKHPEWRENVKLSTWHKGPYGPFYLRDFTLDGLDGERLVECTSSWIILDVSNRRMCRTSEVMDMVPEDTVCKDNSIESPAEKVVMPKGVETEPAGVHVVEYSDVDLLGHANNARYVVWAMDCLDFAELVERPVREILINFNHETHVGDEISLEKVRMEDEEGRVTYFIDGKADGKQAFCTRIVL